MRRALSLLLCFGVAVNATNAAAHYELCFTETGEDPCPTGERCSQSDGGPGICLPPPCTNDASCVTEPLRLCDLRATPSVCIQCRSDAECAPPSVCELDLSSPVSNRCVACTPSAGEAVCERAPGGRLCLFGKGVCGCIRNSDCAQGTFCRRNGCIPRPVAGDQDAGVPDGGVALPAASSRGSGCAASGGGGSDAGVSLTLFVAGTIALRRRRR